jgi:hypothetical protein
LLADSPKNSFNSSSETGTGRFWTKRVCGLRCRRPLSIGEETGESVPVRSCIEVEGVMEEEEEVGAAVVVESEGLAVEAEGAFEEEGRPFGAGL